MNKMLQELFKEFIKNLIYDEFKESLIKIKKYIKSKKQSNRLLNDDRDQSLTKKTSENEKLINIEFDNNCSNNQHRTNFSKRIDYLMKVLKEYRKEVNIEWLSNKLGLKSSNELKKYYNSNEEPMFDFIEEIENKIGIKSDWLKSGTDTEIFETTFYTTNKELLNYIQSNDIKTIYFAFSKAGLSKFDNSELIIVFKFDDLKFITNTLIIPFGGYVGGHGERMIKELYRFLLLLKKENYLDKCRCVSISKEEQDELVFGKKYGYLVTNRNFQNIKFDIYDIININSDDYSDDVYCAKIYGETFVECRRIIMSDKDIDNIENF